MHTAGQYGLHFLYLHTGVDWSHFLHIQYFTETKKKKTHKNIDPRAIVLFVLLITIIIIIIIIKTRL